MLIWKSFSIVDGEKSLHKHLKVIEMWDQNIFKLTNIGEMLNRYYRNKQCQFSIFFFIFRNVYAEMFG